MRDELESVRLVNRVEIDGTLVKIYEPLCLLEEEYAARQAAFLQSFTAFLQQSADKHSD